jgi:hypothetical protein
MLIDLKDINEVLFINPFIFLYKPLKTKHLKKTYGVASCGISNKSKE